jgi:hypothetical protein
MENYSGRSEVFESKADIENIAKTLVEELIEASGSHSKMANAIILTSCLPS